jgi:hypothetical protein
MAEVGPNQVSTLIAFRPDVSALGAARDARGLTVMYSVRATSKVMGQQSRHSSGAEPRPKYMLKVAKARMDSLDLL